MATAVQRPVRLPISNVFTFGQVSIRPMPTGRFRLCHRDDSEHSETLQLFHTAEDALEIGRVDDDGNYRPLKTAPNLRHKWRLELATAEELSRALDFFYPGRLAMLAARAEKRLNPTPLRDSLGRQSGMYRVAANISDEQLNNVIGRFCRSDGGCLRTILWKRDATGTIPSTKLPPEKFDPAYDQVLASRTARQTSENLPLLCQEACNLLVAECRNVVKAKGTD